MQSTFSQSAQHWLEIFLSEFDFNFLLFSFVLFFVSIFVEHATGHNLSEVQSHEARKITLLKCDHYKISISYLKATRGKGGTNGGASDLKSQRVRVQIPAFPLWF